MIIILSSLKSENHKHTPSGILESKVPEMEAILDEIILNLIDKIK